MTRVTYACGFTVGEVLLLRPQKGVMSGRTRPYIVLYIRPWLHGSAILTLLAVTSVGEALGGLSCKLPGGTRYSHVGWDLTLLHVTPSWSDNIVRGEPIGPGDLEVARAHAADLYTHIITGEP